MTFTKERLTALSNRENVGAILAEEIAELARIALASLEAEAVAYIRDGFKADGVHFCGGIITAEEHERTKPALSDRYNWKHQPLYTAPPAPVVPDEMDLLTCHLDGVTETYAEGWNACRAAILQGAEPVSQHPELTVWYGSMPESNGKANWTAILRRKWEGIQDGMTIDRSEYPDRVLYAADRVRYLIGEKADRPCILDYDADAHSGYVKPGNSPQILDGYVLVPSDPTSTQWAAGMKAFDSGMDKVTRVYKAMLAAAPQQEAE